MQTFEELFELIQQYAKMENYPEGSGTVRALFNTYDWQEAVDMANKFVALNEYGKKGKYAFCVYCGDYGVEFTWKSIDWGSVKDLLDGLTKNLE